MHRMSHDPAAGTGPGGPPAGASAGDVRRDGLAGPADSPGTGAGSPPSPAPAGPSLDRVARARVPGLGRLAPAIVFAVALVVYGKTLLPGIAFGDWGEMQAVPHVLGVAHPTGYPTYILLAWLVELLPIGSVALRANLLSAFLVAGSLATMAAIAGRLGVRPLIAIGASLAAGAIGTIWAAATVAEVNPLHLFLIAIMLHRALLWDDLRRPRDLVIGGLVIGLALGNHLLTLFVVPFVGLFVAWAGRRELIRRPIIAIPGILAVLAGLAVYLYIPLAANSATPLQYNHPTTWDGVYWLVTGVQFRGQFDFLSSKGPGEFLASLPDLWRLAIDRATWVIPMLAAIGAAFLLRRRTAFALLCLGLLVMGGYLWANYLRLEHYLLVPWLLTGVLAAAGLEGIARSLDWATERARAGGYPRLPRLAPVVGVVSLAIALGLGAINWSESDRSGDEAGRQYVDALLAALPPNAAVISGWDFSTPLWYATHVEGVRPDVLVVDDSNIVYDGWETRENAVAQLICQRPIYAIRYDDDAELGAMRQLYSVTPALDVLVAWGSPSGSASKTVYRIEPRPGTCPA